ncbi:MAG: YHS domain-containing (seleno)protein [Pseudomonadota bacterium]
MRTLLAALALVAAPIAFAPAAYAQKAEIYTGRFSNVAVGGYDPVAYFTSGAPTKGSKDFTTEYLGAEFRFASQENLDAFLADPVAYAPQYGGYCAWAVAEGKTAKGDPDHWRIVDDKLYLNFNKSIQSKWDADIPGFIQRGDANWPTVLN